MRSIFCLLTLALALSSPLVWASTEETIEEIEAFLAFTEYEGGILLSEQIPQEDWQKFHIVDTRKPTQFEVEHISGAYNIEWREILSRRHELPEDKPILLYCDSGVLSAQAALALKIAGYDSVMLLHGGYKDWILKGGFDANAQYLKKKGLENQSAIHSSPFENQ
jgi:rhodanese-related sulfurtransferase